MKEIIVKTQQELDQLPESFGEYTTIIIKSEPDNLIIIKNDRGSSHVVARGSSHVEARESSHVVAWGSSHVVAWESSHVEARESSHVVAWGSSHVVAWESSHVEARESVSVDVSSPNSIVLLFSFAVAIVAKNIKAKITKKSKTAIIQRTKESGWFDNNGIQKTPKVILFKRVSKDFLTQEGAPNETKWEIGSTVTHPAWNPDKEECGGGKYHACSRPYFCDEFRNQIGDKYIAIEIKLKDLYEWKNPTYPHKIGFREGKVLHEVDSTGDKRKGVK